MNVGAYLVSKSPLSSGTALQHLLTMQMGGTGGTVFAAMFAVQIDTPRLTLAQRAKREAGETDASTPRQIDETGDDKDAVVLTRQAAMSVLTAADDLTVIERRENSVFVRALDDDCFTVRDVAVDKIN